MPELDDFRLGISFFKEFVELIQSLIDKDRLKYLNAIEAVHKAATKTNFYLRDIRERKEENKEKEQELTKLWYEASKAIQTINPELAEKCLIKGQCWSDPRLFESQEYEGIPLSIDYMFSETRKILREMK